MIAPRRDPPYRLVTGHPDASEMFARCPMETLAVCPQPTARATLVHDWQARVDAGEAIPIIGCGNPWHYVLDAPAIVPRGSTGTTVHTPDPRMAFVLGAVVNERRAQLAKWGRQDHDLTVWMTVLGEEFGEACEAILKSRAFGSGSPDDDATDRALGEAFLADRVRQEMIQVAAVAVAAVEWLDDRMFPPSDDQRRTAAEPTSG